MGSKHDLPPEERRKRRARLLRRFAVLDGGRPRYHEDESYWSPDYHSVGKVCLNSEGHARRLAAALLWIGEDRQEPYTCRAGHWHLRNAEKAARQRERLRRDHGSEDHPRSGADHARRPDARGQNGMA
jgi:hypothetical protein